MLGTVTRRVPWFQQDGKTSTVKKLLVRKIIALYFWQMTYIEIKTEAQQGNRIETAAVNNCSQEIERTEIAKKTRQKI